MSDIQANVVINDKIDKNIEIKLTALADKSLKASDNITRLNNAIKNLSVNNINAVKTALQGLSNINPLKNVNLGALQLVNSISKSQVALAQANASMAKAQLASQRLASEQARTASIAQRSADQQAIASARIAEIKARERVAEERLASAKALTAQRQARLDEITRRSANGIKVYQGGLLGLFATINNVTAGLANFGKFIDFGDTYQRSINKLTLVTKSAEEARNRLTALTTGALASYGNLESYTALYTRLDMALKNVGGTASEAMAVTQTLSKTVALAGLTSAEASSALLQISQAFNKGKLDGDEFRTVMETMPPLADAIAREMSRAGNGVKILRGDLLKLAPKGAITAEVMKRAVISMAEEIDSRFAKLTPTVGMELENLKTKATVFFGSLFKDEGIGSGINSALRLIGDNLGTITKVAIVAGSAIVGAFAVKHLVNMSTYLLQVSTTFATLRTQALASSTAIGLTNTALKSTYAWTTALFNTIKASPMGLLLTGVSLLTVALEGLFSLTGNELFPNFDEDKAQLDDYLSRLTDVSDQMATMSSIAIDREYDKTEKALQQLNAESEKYRKEMEQQQAILERNKQAQKFEQEQSVWRLAYINEYDSAIQSLALTEEKALDVRIKHAEAEEHYNKAKADSSRVVEAQLQLLIEQKDRLDNLNKVIDEGTTANKHSQSEIDNAKVRVAEITERYGDLNAKIAQMIGLLNTLSADKFSGVAGTALAVGERVANLKLKVAQEKINAQAVTDFTKRKESLDLDLKIVKARQSGNKELERSLQVEKKLANLSHLKEVTTDGRLIKDPKTQTSAYDELAKTESELLAREEALKEAKSSKKGGSKGSQKLSPHDKALQKLSEFKQGLVDENNLLSQGYSQYEKYQSLYKLKAEIQQKGVDLSNQELNAMKEQIDLNTKLKELAQEINKLEENSVGKAKEKVQLQLQAIAQSNLSAVEKAGAVDKVYKDQGVITGVNQGVQGIQNEYALRMELLRQYHEQAKTSEFEFQQEMLGLSMASEQAKYDQRLANLQNMGALGQATATAFESFTSNATNSLMNVLNGTESISGAMRNLATTILNDVVKSIVTMGVKWLAQQAMQLAFGKTAEATQLASASALLAVYSPLATAVSLASYGANSAPAMAGMSSAYALGKTLSIAGARRNGGSISAGELYQVGEGNAPEIYQSNSGRQYMIAGDNGRVFSNREVTGGGNGGTTIIQNITYQGSGDEVQDKRTMQNLSNSLRATILDVIRSESRVGGELSRG